MKKIIELITDKLKIAFEQAGYSSERVIASVSNRPDLCEYQCNGAMLLAKEAHKAPIMIATEVVDCLKDDAMFSDVSACNPGFINMSLSGDVIAEYVSEMSTAERFGAEGYGKPTTIVVDYGGANVAKPLHIGHLRSAIIGESVKRICAYMGAKTIGDTHLGDWGLQMGQIIAELKVRQPDLPYFDENFDGEYPKEAPFTITNLEEIYPCASKKCKPESDTYDEAFYDAAKQATAQLQLGRRGYRALWDHIMNVSRADLKKNYDNLNVHFELWYGESDAQSYVPGMIEDMKASGILVESDGAWVVDVAEESDKKELPPCIVVKSDGATLYATTDLATLLQRKLDFDPDAVIYLTDKRQSMHFVQVFRTAHKAGIIGDDVKLTHIGFGTMNGSDGKPFKTRDGGVLRLETLINDINEAVYEKMKGNPEISDEEARVTSKIVALSALKYGDLSNQASKDYIFDLKRFIEFEGNTGPYILYTIVRIKSILAKYGKAPSGKITFEGQPRQKSLMLELSRFAEVIEDAADELAPHKICSYIYDLSNTFSSFYHDVKILSEPDEKVKDSYISLLDLTKRVLETCIDLLGFSAPERM